MFLRMIIKCVHNVVKKELNQQIQIQN